MEFECMGCGVLMKQKAKCFKELPEVLQNELSKRAVNTLNDITRIESSDLHFLPMYVRYYYDRERVPILHSVVLITILMCVLGIATAMYLDELWERIALSACYSLLLVSAALNQGLIDRRYWLVDILSAQGILLLNIYFFWLVLEWWHFLFGGLNFIWFAYYNYHHVDLTCSQYELYTNIWHLGVILMIYFIPFSLEQKNLF